MKKKRKRVVDTVTVSIIGVGSRGGHVYGTYMNELKDKYDIVALCDKRPERLKHFGDAFGVDEKARFLDEDEFFEKKRSDLLVIATLDALHVRMALRALPLGYDLLLEKPISGDEKECKKLLRAAKQYGRKIIVAHVLRYTVAVRKAKEILDSGVLGRLIRIDHTEQVRFWHIAHSYVRGNWRREEETTPILLAKCCHDLDLLQYFVGSPCKTVSSVGGLRFFKKKNAPKGSTERCLDCPYVDSCVYSAKSIYPVMWKKTGCPETMWPQNVLTDVHPLTEEALTEAIKTGPYGRCVFRCDNDVCDDQHVSLEFENGVTALLKMEAFTYNWGRRIEFIGTEGVLYLDEEHDLLRLSLFKDEVTEWKISELTDDLSGHGGGDHVMVQELYRFLTEDDFCPDTAIEGSLESHFIAFAAEKSRHHGGKPYPVKR